MADSSTTAPRGSVGIHFDRVEKRFASLVALRGISLNILPGEFVALLGHNGAGKTTLLRIAALLMHPTGGQIQFEASANSPMPSTSAKRLIGMVAHNTLLYDELSAVENLTLFAELYGLDNVRARVSTSLDSCGLSSRAGSLVRTFSRGMHQRLAIARALLHGPRLLLLDEPAAGLNEQEQKDLAKRIRSFAAEGITVLVVEHNLVFLAALAERLICLDRGKVIAAGLPEAVRREPAVIEAYLGLEADVAELSLAAPS